MIYFLIFLLISGCNFKKGAKKAGSVKKTVGSFVEWIGGFLDETGITKNNGITKKDAELTFQKLPSYVCMIVGFASGLIIFAGVSAFLISLIFLIIYLFKDLTQSDVIIVVVICSIVLGISILSSCSIISILYVTCCLNLTKRIEKEAPGTFVEGDPFEDVEQKMEENNKE